MVLFAGQLSGQNQQTVGTLDLGGASTQITFLPRFEVRSGAWVGTARPVERPEHGCILSYHFVSTGTSRTSVVYKTSVFLFPLRSALADRHLQTKEPE